MYVYGGTSKREVRKLDWSIDRVVDEGIHPWSLDLFDQNPKLIRCDGEDLFFRRLTDLVFAYEAGERIIVGCCDGQRKLCLSGKNTTLPIDAHIFTFSLGRSTEELVLTDLQTLENQFDQHWKEYLRRIFESRDPLVIYKVASAKKMRMRKGHLILETSNYADGRRHWDDLGVRLITADSQEWSVPVKLPPELAWPYRHLARFRPAISGSVVGRWLLGMRTENIEVRITATDEELQSFGNLLERTDAKDVIIIHNEGRFLCHFGVGDVTYALHRDETPRRKAELEPLPGSSLSELRLSMDGKRLIGSRLALFDLSRRQCRLVKPILSARTGKQALNEQLSRLADNNIRVLPDVGGRDFAVEGCHIDPLVPDYLESFRQATCYGRDEDPLGSILIRSRRFDNAFFSGGVIHYGASEESEPEPEPEPGPRGLSPQYINEVLRDLAVWVVAEHAAGRRKTACVTIDNVRDYLISRLPIDFADDQAAPDWLQWLKAGGSEKNRFSRKSKALSQAFSYSDDVDETEFTPDYMSYIVFRYTSLFGDKKPTTDPVIARTCFVIKRYLSAINKLSSGRTPKAEDMQIVEELESLPLLRDAMGSIEDFRFHLLAAATTSGVMAAKLHHRKLPIDDLQKLTVRLCIAAYDYVHVTNRRSSDDVLSRLVRRQAFCPHCAGQIIEDMIQHPEEAPEDIRQVCKRFRFRVNLTREEMLENRKTPHPNDFAPQLARGKMSCIRHHERGRGKVQFKKGMHTSARRPRTRTALIT